MITLEILLVAASLLLVVAGGPKVIDPVPVALLLRDAGVRAGRFTGRALGLCELTAGALGLVSGRWWAAAAVALLYVGFAAVLLGAIVRGSDRPCGCFGVGGTPPGPAHVAVDLVFAAGGAWAGLTGARPAWDIASEGDVWPLAAAAAVAAGAILTTRIRPRA